MNPIKKALWYVESHLDAELSLDSVASVAGVSKFHLTRIFVLATGSTVMAYARARRLSKAARALADGAPDILALALDSGYGSHEAFTRAFRDQFGTTPDTLRAQGHVNDIQLVEAIMIDNTPGEQLAEPALEELGQLRLAGLREHFGAGERARIPALWQRFAPSIGRVPGQEGFNAYGIVFNAAADGSMDYMCAVALAKDAPAPAGFETAAVAPHRYLAFKHTGHVSGVSSTFMAIFGQWLPASGHTMDEAPLLERYTEKFDGRTGRGEIDILVPIK
jgi:AraC family transcriptional regulator